MKKNNLLIAYLGIILFGIFIPILELIRTNPNIKELYGFDLTDFVMLVTIVLTLPVIISFFNIKLLKNNHLLCYILIVQSYLFFAYKLSLIGKMSTVPLVILVILLISKKFSSFVKLMSFIALFYIPLALYKSYEVVKDVLPFESSSIHAKNLSLKTNSPENIFFILMDGTDFTSFYLDENNLPRADLLPNMHTYFKQDFLWYPNTFSNTPQTYMSIPVMLTGIDNVKAAQKSFQKGDDLLSDLKSFFNIKGYFYKNYYAPFCSKGNSQSCFPFTEKNQKSGDSSYLIILQMYFHRITWGLTKLPFKLGKDFKPEYEKYKVNDLNNEVGRIKKNSRNFFYAHIFRRSLLELISFDEEFGILLKALKEKNIYEKSMIVIIADHGLDYTQSGIIYGHVARYTSNVFRIPLAIKPPGLNGGKVMNYRAQTIDLRPTIHSLVFNEPEKRISNKGQDLLSAPTNDREILVTCLNEGKWGKSSFKNPFMADECTYNKE